MNLNLLLLWERFAATSKVKSQLRRFMRSKKRDEHITFGKEILLNAFKNEDIEFSDIVQLNKALKTF